MTLCELSPIECRSSLGLTTSISPSLTAHRRFKNGCQTNKERWIMKFGLTAFFSVMTCLSSAWAQAIPPHAEGLNEELVEVQIDGGTQRAVVSRLQGKPDGSKLLVLLPGYPSVVRPELSNGIMTNSPLLGNFLIRARRHLVTEHVMTLLVDCHSQMGDVCRPEYQSSKERYKHVKAVIDAARAKHPAVKEVYLISTSMGSISSAFIALNGQTEFAGVIHTASIDPTAPRSYVQLNNFDYAAIKIPQAFIHHVEDPCPVTQFAYFRTVAQKYKVPLISVTGGGDFRGPPCQAFTQHGFRGKELVVMRHVLKMLSTSPWVSEEI
ncbi:alpha/beta hydrolase [Limnohabitans sp.]|uniref:alpha/beta hydrolase n=1 Tax=Limnohabitans sp. TaxID=1907725 RepID=UPI0039BC9E7F|nr:alpha/beta hydrolase [Comamonadaceae bacterium]